MNQAFSPPAQFVPISPPAPTLYAASNPVPAYAAPTHPAYVLSTLSTYAPQTAVAPPSIPVAPPTIQATPPFPTTPIYTPAYVFGNAIIVLVNMSAAGTPFLIDLLLGDLTALLQK